MMFPPQFASPMTVQGFPGVNSLAPFPPQGGSGNWAPPQTQPPNMQYIQQAATRGLLARGQAPDEAPAAPTTVAAEERPVTLHIPSPGELGIETGQHGVHSDLDWAVIHSRLDQLGATCFQMQKTLEGGYRISCLLPTGRQGETHHVEAVAVSESDAVRLALAQVDEWARSR
jgi:hypothetical protein